MTPEIEKLEAAMLEARDKYRAAQDELNAAMIKHGEERLAKKGIVIDETICIASKWGFGDWSDGDRVKVSRITKDGDARCYVIKKDGTQHFGRHQYEVDIDHLKIEATS